jgi:four helix bundle protein
VRDHTRLKVFELADELTIHVYRQTAEFPASERYGLQSQIRRAAVSIAANIVEGCSRSTHNEYLRFIEIAYGSARELQYEISVAQRLGYLESNDGEHLHNQCTATAKALNGLLCALREPHRK